MQIKSRSFSSFFMLGMCWIIIRKIFTTYYFSKRGVCLQRFYFNIYIFVSHIFHAFVFCLLWKVKCTTIELYTKRSSSHAFENFGSGIDNKRRNMHYTKAFPSIKKNPKKKMSTKNKYKQEPITYVAGLVSNCNTSSFIRRMMNFM